MTDQQQAKTIEVLERRLKREKTARLAAENILESKSLELFLSNQKLSKAVVELQKLKVAVQQSPIIVLITDTKGIIEYVNQSFTVISGYSEQDVLGKDIRHLGIINDKEPEQGLKHVIKYKSIWQGESQGESATKRKYQVKITISPILDESKNISHFQFNCEDITVQKQNEEKIYKLAHYDSLTKLSNRFSISDILQQSIVSAQLNSTILSVLFIDMDRFKQINDTHGHKCGDLVLQEVAARLKGICRRQNDYIARIGGDEFLVVLSDIEDISYAALTAETIVEMLSLPYICNQQELKSSPSIGIAVYPNDGNSAQELIKHADTAMYHAKDNGKAQYSFFTQELNAIIEEKNQIEQALRAAMLNDQLELYYQPQIYLNDSNQCGVEALLRWNHETLGFISPERFIAIAEERGIIYELGTWVLQTAFKQLKQWIQVSRVPIKMAINLSAKQISNQNFVSDLRLLVVKYDIAPQMIELEITESIAIENPEESIKTLQEIRALGFELAIDDFGTGYSSLSYLKHLPVQTLKLDKTFVDNLENDLDNSKICKAAISLSHDLGLYFVAEGVETLGQAKYLQKHGCDVMQGYYFSRAVPADQAFEFMQNYKWQDL